MQCCDEADDELAQEKEKNSELDALVKSLQGQFYFCSVSVYHIT